MDQLKEVVAKIELVSTKTQAELDFFQKELSTCEQELSHLKSQVKEEQKSKNDLSQQPEAETKSKNDLAQQLEAEKKSKAELILQFELQAEEIKKSAVSEFRRSEYFSDNLLKMQGSLLAMGQTYAIDACSEVYPALDKNHPQLSDLYNPEAEAMFNKQLEQFKEGADLREAEDEEE